MEQKRIAENTFQNAFCLFNLLLSSKMPRFPHPHDMLSGKEVAKELD